MEGDYGSEPINLTGPSLSIEVFALEILCSILVGEK